jgi:cyclic-di-GMP-binding protein
MIKKDIKVREGIDKDLAKKVVKVIKDSGLKVQASIMEDQIRVTGKKIDDLQNTIVLVKQGSFNYPMQFINFRN